jgi:DNA-binding PadR family transcriptional regulator
MRDETDAVDGFLPLTRTAMHVLLALGEGEKHGWAIREHAEAVTGGTVRPGPGTLYDAIAKMEERGLIEESPDTPEGEPDHAQRRYYRLSGLGRRVLDAEIRRLSEVVEYAWAHGLGRPHGEGGQRP